MRKFGSVVRYKDSFFIWLGEDEESTYAAKILDREYTRDFQALRRTRDRQPQHPIHRGTALCFVILNTEEFRELAAYLHNTDAHFPGTSEEYFYKGELKDHSGDLVNEDIQALKDEILKDTRYPSRLREIIAKYSP